MKLKRSKIIEIFGILGVVGSLVFVGLEIRQAAIATRSATVQEIKNGWLTI